MDHFHITENDPITYVHKYNANLATVNRTTVAKLQQMNNL